MGGVSLDIQIERSSGESLPAQIKRQIADGIAAGSLAPGDRLLPVRQLASQLQISPVTVLRAYAELEAAGLVERRPNRGAYIRRAAQSQPQEVAARRQDRSPATSSAPSWQRLPDASLPPGGVIALHTASVQADLLPTRDLIGDLRAAVSDDPTFFGAYSPLAGESGLRARIAAYLGTLGAPVSPDDVLITGGAQQAVDLIARAFIEPGDAVAIESPTYPAAIDVFRSRGARLHPIPVDAAGMDVARLADIPDLRLVYIVPDFHNPTGVVLSEKRRADLVELAQRRNFLVLEDDPWREIHFGQAPPPPMRSWAHGGQVIHVKSFSKLLAAGIRLGAVVAEGPAFQRLLAVKSLADGGTGLLEQWTIRAFMGSPRMERHLRRLAVTMKGRRDLILGELRQGCPDDVHWTEPDGGFSIWLDIGKRRSAQEVCRSALQQGAALAPGDAFFAHATPSRFLRLTYSAASEEDLLRGAGVLCRVLREGSGG